MIGAHSLWSRVLIVTCALLLALPVSVELSALSLTPLSLSALVKRSPLIIHGRVIAQEVTRRPSPSGGQWLFTLSTIEVAECWRSEGPCPKQVIVSQIGGALPAQGPDSPALELRVPGMPTLKLGDEAGLFLTPKRGAEGSAPPIYVIVGGPQGQRLIDQARPAEELRAQVQRLDEAHRATLAPRPPKP